MNILHMTYAVEVAKTGSISKASEALLVAQPNLSRSIKELESDLGIVIFQRSSRGMSLTAEGEVFVGHAKRLLAQINAVENLYKNGRAAHQKFSVSAPPAVYLSDAFVRFAVETDAVPGELCFSETIASQAISRVSLGEDNFGIVRFALPYGEHFQRVFEDKGLKSEPIAAFHYVLLLSKESPLSDGRLLWRSDLSDLFEIIGTDPLAPMAAAPAPAADGFSATSRRRITAADPNTRFAILRERRDAFLWSLPLPAETLARNGLVSRECVDCKKHCRDVLIYRKDYHLDAVDQRFVETLRLAGAQLGRCQ